MILCYPSLVGIPAACFLSAFSVLSPEDRPRLVNLATTIDGPTTILPLLGIDTVEVAEMGSRLPEQSAAHAIIETRKMDASLATYLGRIARTELPDDAVLDLGP